MVRRLFAEDEFEFFVSQSSKSSSSNLTSLAEPSTKRYTRARFPSESRLGSSSRINVLTSSALSVIFGWKRRIASCSNLYYRVVVRP